MRGPVVLFEGVWKKFRTGERHDSLRDLVPAVLKSLVKPTPRTELQQQEFWALENVSFELFQGEALGIIGPNGAGKSTILKVLTRILRPNRGRSVIYGRVGALIEVAAGFHPDLTGRENVYLQGAIMGMKRKEVTLRFDEIVEFAGVGPFIDTPVKRYSSGMNARLGFSIAAHLKPEVLIIDEVLSVGDMAFQERCVNRMREFRHDGVTIVFVSHNLQAVSELCDKALYLNREPRAFGQTSEVIDRYVRDSFTTSSNPGERDEWSIPRCDLVDAHGDPLSGSIAPGEPLCLRVEFEPNAPTQDVGFSFRVFRSTDRLLVYEGQLSQRELRLDLDRPGRFTLLCAFKANLTRGQYYCEITAGHAPTQRFLARLSPAAHLVVAESRTWGGVADLMVSASVQQHAEPLTVVPAGRLV